MFICIYIYIVENSESGPGHEAYIPLIIAMACYERPTQHLCLKQIFVLGTEKQSGLKKFLSFFIKDFNFCLNYA